MKLIETSFLLSVFTHTWELEVFSIVTQGTFYPQVLSSSYPSPQATACSVRFSSLLLSCCYVSSPVPGPGMFVLLKELSLLLLQVNPAPFHPPDYKLCGG